MMISQKNLWPGSHSVAFDVTLLVKTNEYKQKIYFPWSRITHAVFVFRFLNQILKWILKRALAAASGNPEEKN